MRSLLFVPGDSERKLTKALESGADALILDLEDSVAADAKPRARGMVREFLQANAARAAPRLYVRVNDLHTGLLEADIGAVMRGRPAGIVLPKSDGAEDVLALAMALRVAEAEADLDDGVTGIIAIMTETPLGLLSARSYIRDLPRLQGLTWGAEDLSAAIGASSPRDDDGTYTGVFELARSLTLLAAAGAGVAAIDTVSANFRDEKGFEAECRAAERDGFTGRMAIHPAQVAVINETFTPSRAAVVRAQAVVHAFSAADAPGVIAIDGKMYDRPHLRLAKRLLDRARSAGVI